MPTSSEHRKRMLQHLEEQQRQRACMKAARRDLHEQQREASINGTRQKLTDIRCEITDAGRAALAELEGKHNAIP